jgi:hypothetical protein
LPVVFLAHEKTTIFHPCALENGGINLLPF